MRLIKSLLLIALVVVGIGAGLVFASRYVPEEKWNGTKISLGQIQPFISNSIQTAQQTKISENVHSWTGKVLGVQDNKDGEKENASLPKKTIDFARYSYCKEVVENYEAAQEK
jgi:hypothetical protein